MKDSLYSDTLAASDPDSAPLAYALVKYPAGMTLAGNIISWKAAIAGPCTVSVSVTDAYKASDTLTWVVLVRVMMSNTTPRTRHDIPDFYFLFDYVDTVSTDMKGDSFFLLSGTDSTVVLSYTPGDSFCVVRWTYDTVGTSNYDSSYHAIPDGRIHISVLDVWGNERDTLTWDVKVNTLPWIETSQYQVTTMVYLGNTYTDTIVVSDVDGDIPRFTVTDTGGLGVQISNVTRNGDTSFCAITWTVADTGAFGVSINVADTAGGIAGYDTSLALTFKAQEKKLITSLSRSMTYGTAIGVQYRDTIGVFSEFRAGLSSRLLRGPIGMMLSADSIIRWTPSAVAVETVTVVMSHANYAKGADTLTWVVKAVASSGYVFWYNALVNGYNLQANPGPGLPAGVTVFEGSIATWNTRLSAAENEDDFALGNGLGQSGRSAMFYSADLCDKQGTAIRAVVRGEFRDGWSTTAYCHPGQIIMKVGVIDLTVYRDLPVPNGYWGAIECDELYVGGMPALKNPWSYDMMFYYKPGTVPVQINGLMAEEIVTIQAPQGRLSDQDGSVLDKQFYDIVVTRQVQWILDRKGRDYVETGKAGDYAIVFLVPNDWTAGGYGKVNLYADECVTPFVPANDAPWTQDGNTMHLYLQGDISPAP